MNNSTKIGLVGFLDILGYQNLLERNEPETIAEEVVPILLGIKQKVKDTFATHVSDDNGLQSAIFGYIDDMEWVSFSDTILITLPLDQDNKTRDKHGFPWMIFLTAMDMVQGALFTAGLPARGAIDYGKFFIKGTCFAGRTIVNAYHLSGQIEMAACVLSNNAVKELDNISKHAHEFNTFVTNYLVPMKTTEQDMQVVRSIPSDINQSNVRQDVLRAFWGNKKNISQLVQQKIANTEQWFEFQLTLRN